MSFESRLKQLQEDISELDQIATEYPDLNFKNLRGVLVKQLEEHVQQIGKKVVDKK